MLLLLTLMNWGQILGSFAGTSGGLKWKRDDNKLLHEEIEDREGALLTVFTECARE